MTEHLGSSAASDAEAMPAIDLPRVHSALAACLSSIDDLCKRHGIEYWIDSGTLLGAVRHRGFIPWDDDIDLCMTRSNLRKFVTVAKTELQPHYSVQTPSDDRAIGVDAKIYVQGSHMHNPDLTRLGLTPTQDDGLYADIYIADPMSKSRMVRKLERAAAWLVKTHAWADQMAQLPTLPAMKRLRWLLASHMPDSLVQRIERVLDTRMSRRTPSYLGVGPAGLFNGMAYDVSAIYPLRLTEFAGLQVPAPQDADTYLTGMYGSDYMTLPPIDQRRSHAARVWFDD